MKYTTVFVGMDVHKESFSLACYTNEKEEVEYVQRTEAHYYWQKQVWDKATNAIIPRGQSGDPQAHPVQFAQVNLVPDNPSTDADIVIRKNSWTVEIRNTANVSLLSIVLQAVTGSV